MASFRSFFATIDSRLVAKAALLSLLFSPNTSHMLPTAAPTTLPPDPHSYASRSPVRVRHLALRLTVDFDQHTLAGTATWQLANPGDRKSVV